MISPLSSSNNSSSISPLTARTSAAFANSAASSSYSDGISLDAGYESSVIFGTEDFTEKTNPGYLISEVDSDINNGNLSDVAKEIDTYTSSLASSNVYESTYSTPSASFLADLKALKSDAASNNLTIDNPDLANARLDAPRYAAGAYEAGDMSGLASMLEESTDDIADYLQTQGDTAVQAKAEGSAIMLSHSIYLGLGSIGPTPTDPSVTSQISDLAASAANQNYSAASSTGDPMFKIFESLLESAAVSNSARLQTLSLLDAPYGTSGTGAASSSPASDASAASGTKVSSFA